MQQVTNNLTSSIQFKYINFHFVFLHLPNTIQLQMNCHRHWMAMSGTQILWTMTMFLVIQSVG
jgi:hypothetical protein